MNDPATANPDIHVLEQLIAVWRRRWKTVVALVVLGVLAGFVYAESQAPEYATSATILVRSGFAADPIRQGIETTTPEEEGQFLSQLEYIKSASVAARVDDALKLQQDMDFARPALSGYKRLAAVAEQALHLKTGLAGKLQAPTLDRDQVIGRLQANVKALRAGRTYVAAISYSHPDPAVAQKVAQAYAEAFRQVLAEASDAANARVKAAVEAELAKATPETRAALEQKYQDVVMQRALPGVDAVVISDARKPAAPIAPRKPFLIVVGAILGAALGCLLAGWREMRDRGVRDGDLLARRLKTRFLGYVPVLSISSQPGSLSGTNMTLPAGARLTVTEPFSRFGEVVRAAAVLVQAAKPNPVVAITSTLAGEGKTVFAANLASHIGNQGKKVLLIDADFRHPELSDWLAPGAEQGVLDTLLQNRPLSETGVYDSRSNVTLLAAALKGRGIEPAGMLAGSQMRQLIATQRGLYDVVILDLPSLTAAADAAAVAPLVDAFLLVAEWGTPTPELIETVLASEPDVASKLAGVAVTKTSFAKLPLYVSAVSRGAYQKRIG